MRIVLAGILLSVLVSSSLADDTPFTLRNGDRVVLVGDTFIERDQRYGYLETNLLARYPGIKVRFRNLGWSADTVDGLSRAYFDAPAKGRERLLEQVAAENPTVLIAAYGMAASFDGQNGVSQFTDGLNRLLNDIVPKKSRVVLLSPIFHEDLGAPLPNPAEHNRSLRAYARGIQDVARGRGFGFLDLHAQLDPANRVAAQRQELTFNGIHLTEPGYWYVALDMERALGLPAETIAAELTADGKTDSVTGTKISNLRSTAAGLAFDQLDARLPTPTVPARYGRPLRHPQATTIQLKVTGLPAGRYSLSSGGKPIQTATAKSWAAGVTLQRTPQHRQANRLRSQVNRKNRMFFAKYRPQNITYLLGFRRYEQGQNAVELEDLGKLVEQAETQIDKTRIPQTHRFVLKRATK